MTRLPPGRPVAAGRRRRWVPPALWAAAILVVTSWPNPNVPTVGRTDWVAHAAMYAGLTYLVWRAVLPSARVLVTALLVVAGASAFGWVDEWHQQFIPGRSSSLSDWAADSLGGVLGVLAALTRRPAQPA